MSYGRTILKGLIFCDRRMASQGFTLLTPVEGSGAWLIDMMGEVIKWWKFSSPAANFAELLPNGNILYAGIAEEHALSNLEGASGTVLEIDWNGNPVWEYSDKFLHHGVCRTRGGNTIVLKWIELPNEIATKIEGGDNRTEKDGVMYGELIQEIRPDGRVMWEWEAHKHIGPDELKRCPLCPRDTWLHCNWVSELANGDILVSFAKVNTVAIIQKNTGHLKWRWGSDGELAHQHSPMMTENGNVLIFDNGYHPSGIEQNYSRLVEVAPNGSMVWSYVGPKGGEMKNQIYSSMWSNCQRLPNENTLACEGTTGRVFEVTKWGELVWEWVNHFPTHDANPKKAMSYPLYAGFRYGMDFPGLKKIR